MRKNNPGAIFIRGFLKSFLFIGLLFAVGFGSYKLTMFYYRVTDTVPRSSKADNLIKDIVSDVQIDDVSKNLIYSVNEDKNTIEDMVLEIFNTYTKNMDYILVPADIRFTVSNDMYKRLCAANPEVPQIIQFSEIRKYFSEDTVYEYGSLLLEDLLGEKISYYTAVQAEDFNTVFEKKENFLILTEEYRSSLKELDEEEETKQYIKDWYDKVDSNLTYKNKLKYLEFYLESEPDYIYCHILPGQQEISYFETDVETAGEFIQGLLENQTYMEMQQFSGEDEQTGATSSIGLKIQIENGSRVTGLAAAYKEKLTGDGYTVTGIGNYEEEFLNSTKIIVKEQGYGNDLKKYFKNCTLEKGEIPEDIDIRIILGKEDS